MLIKFFLQLFYDDQYLWLIYFYKHIYLLHFLDKLFNEHLNFCYHFNIILLSYEISLLIFEWNNHALSSIN